MRRGIIAASNRPWSPESLGLPASVYGDWFRADLSAPAQVGGLLTRWAGLRVAADPYGRFDLTPYSGLGPEVSADGPGGEDVVRMISSSYGVITGSEDRGGASNAYPQGAFAGAWEAAGFTIGFCVKQTGEVRLNFIDDNEGAVRIACSDSPTAVFNASYNADGYINSSQTPAPFSSVWRTFVIRHNGDSTADLFYEGALIHSFTSITPASVQGRWFAGSFLSSDGFVFGAFHARAILSDGDLANLHTWLKG